MAWVRVRGVSDVCLANISELHSAKQALSTYPYKVSDGMVFGTVVWFMPEGTGYQLFQAVFGVWSGVTCKVCRETRIKRLQNTRLPTLTKHYLV